MWVIRYLLPVATALAASLTAAAPSNASPCIPETMAMSPQPVLSCPDQQPMPFPQSAPLGAPGFSPAAPPQGTAVGVPAADAFPAPGQAPYIPPVVNQDGSPADFGQGGAFGDYWQQFTGAAGLLGGPMPMP